MKRFVLALTLLVSGAHAAATQEAGPGTTNLPYPVPSTWQSPRGVIEIRAITDGAVEGTYTHRVPGTLCNTPVPLIGTSTGTTVIVAATLAPCHAIISWRSRVAGTQIISAWTMASVSARGLLGTSSGSETFRRLRP